jgi:hypothetical protein
MQLLADFHPSHGRLMVVGTSHPPNLPKNGDHSQGADTYLDFNFVLFSKIEILVTVCNREDQDPRGEAVG